MLVDGWLVNVNFKQQHTPPAITMQQPNDRIIEFNLAALERLQHLIEAQRRLEYNVGHFDLLDNWNIRRGLMVAAIRKIITGTSVTLRPPFIFGDDSPRYIVNPIGCES